MKIGLKQAIIYMALLLCYLGSGSQSFSQDITCFTEPFLRSIDYGGSDASGSFRFGFSNVNYRMEDTVLRIYYNDSSSTKRFVDWEIDTTFVMSLAEIREKFESFIYREFVQPLDYSKLRQTMEQPFRYSAPRSGPDAGTLVIDFVIIVRPRIPILNTNSGATIRLPFRVKIQPVIRNQSIGFRISATSGRPDINKSLLLSIVWPLVGRVAADGSSIEDMLGRFISSQATRQVRALNDRLANVISGSEFLDSLEGDLPEQAKSAIAKYKNDWRVNEAILIESIFPQGQIYLVVRSGVYGSRSDLNDPQIACTLFKAMLPTTYRFDNNITLQKMEKRNGWILEFGDDRPPVCVEETLTEAEARTFTNVDYVDWVDALRQGRGYLWNGKICVYRDYIYDISISRNRNNFTLSGGLREFRSPGSDNYANRKELKLGTYTSFSGIQASDALSTERLSCRAPLASKRCIITYIPPKDLGGDCWKDQFGTITCYGPEK